MAVKQKIRSQRGATLMAALLFFLVAAVCGSIILAAATATLSRMTTQAEDARAYYSLTSAAQLMRDDLLQSRWQVKVTRTRIGSSEPYTYSYSFEPVIALDSSDNQDTKTFVPDLLSTLSGGGDSSIFRSVNTMTITTLSEGKTLPLVYAKPTDISFNDLYEDYMNGENTRLQILMTNDPDGFDGDGNRAIHKTFKEAGKTRQVYWLELTLDSVKVPYEFVSEITDGSGMTTFVIGWDNATIQKS